MKELIQKINKKNLADATGISYSRLRKYSSGILKSLSVEELNLILNYFQ
jgi:DNA-binding Xre family transcriptional regulator